MARHTVTVNEIRDYLNKECWTQVASSFGADSNKKLETNSHGIYRVTTDSKVTYQGQCLIVAVNAYNEAA